MVTLSRRASARPIDPRLRWLVLAPHPDDETLGAGAIIAQAAEKGRLAGVAYLTNGSASHDLGPDRRADLVVTRKREASAALRRLTGRLAPRPIHLDWNDARPERSGSALFDSSRRRLGALIARRGVTAIAVTALNEPHCDHRAAAELAYLCASDAGHHVSVFEYLVWSEKPSTGMASYVTAEMRIGVRRQALAKHRSQLTGLMGDGFRLPRERLSMPSRDMLFRRLKR
ncbi:MAG: GlcNAc-PI de-N-acetylase [Sphingobium sp.]|uniref:PIG-L deacetylase family protein n=1 Tax=Sphingobium sp. TaxID=1912891 RepID=UPI000DB2503E|nr:PIG-L family deacetylase [Sphingobium sp.]PZU05112.1 MAG: GlcNAc-PI de-N-acetylase [Sphingobium sp.]